MPANTHSESDAFDDLVAAADAPVYIVTLDADDSSTVISRHAVVDE